VDVISAILGGENFVKTTVRPSGVKVDAKTSPVETIPGANIAAGPACTGNPGSVSLRATIPDEVQAVASSHVAATMAARRHTTFKGERTGM
jgi:hypothetical protein